VDVEHAPLEGCQRRWAQHPHKPRQDHPVRLPVIDALD
jgi:hypothetical protein